MSADFENEATSLWGRTSTLIKCPFGCNCCLRVLKEIWCCSERCRAQQSGNMRSCDSGEVTLLFRLLWLPGTDSLTPFQSSQAPHSPLSLSVTRCPLVIRFVFYSSGSQPRSWVCCFSFQPQLQSRNFGKLFIFLRCFSCSEGIIYHLKPHSESQRCICIPWGIEVPYSHCAILHKDS